MKLRTDAGTVEITNDVFTAISGCAATNCFGVKGMAVRSVTDGFVHLLKRESMSRGVAVSFTEQDELNIELHIIIKNGVNIVALCRSIMNQVSYHVSRLTGVKVAAVHVYVDLIMPD